MEEKINIAAILKNKPKGTKLYSILSDGACFLNEASEDSIYIDIDNRERFWCFSAYGSTHSFPNGCVLLFPSRGMRDWSKFDWKRGDVLVSNNGKVKVIFDKFRSNTYLSFIGKYHIDSLECNNPYYQHEGEYATGNFKLEEVDAAQAYINTIQERLGGKLNRKTLKIMKVQQKFKNGDIVTIMPRIGDKLIYLFKAEDDEKYYGHAFLDGNIAIVNEDSYCQKDFSTARPSTEEEKQQLFEALAKEGKAWDADKKAIVGLKPKVDELKPFDKVLVRDSKSDNWRANLFSYIGKDGYYHCVYANWVYCIPYAGNEHLLGTTKDVKE